jgi:predicted Zn-dependent protease
LTTDKKEIKTMTYKLICAILLAALGLSAQTKDDVVFRAMRDELQRSMKKLQLEQLQRPYFIAYRVVESDSKDANASLGSLITSNEGRSRILTVNVRVGDYALDNSNFFSFSFGNGVVFTGFQQLPLDDNYDELRRCLWLATDGAYKKALEDLSHKRAALENKHRTEEVPDFSKQPPTSIDDLAPRSEVSLQEANDLARSLSLTFKESSIVQTSRVDVNVRNSLERYLNSEGTTFTRRDGMVTLRATGSAQAPDGMPLTSGFSVHGNSLKDLPAETSVATRIRDMLDRFNKLQSAPVAKEYNGPVLFEEQAAGEMVARFFAAHLPAEPRIISDNDQITQSMRGQQQDGVSLLNKIGAHVMPDFLTLIDDPTTSQQDGKSLWGAYKVDEEGTPAQKKVVVENGILKTLLTSRAPVRGILQSTGNLRGAGVAPSNVFLTATKSVSAEDLKKQLLDLVKTRGLDYGIVVRRMSNRVATLAYRLYPDGHEELIRNANVTGGPAIFKDIIAVSNTPTIYTETFAPAQRSMLPNFNNFFAGPTLVSYVVPSLLFEDLTIEQPSGEVPKPPFVTNPLTASAPVNNAAH